jgi:hypothetical protein
MKESGDDYEGELLAEQVTLDWHMMESLEERRGWIHQIRVSAQR